MGAPAEAQNSLVRVRGEVCLRRAVCIAWRAASRRLSVRRSPADDVRDRRLAHPDHRPHNKVAEPVQHLARGSDRLLVTADQRCAGYRPRPGARGDLGALNP